MGNISTDSRAAYEDDPYADNNKCKDSLHICGRLDSYIVDNRYDDGADHADGHPHGINIKSLNSIHITFHNSWGNIFQHSGKGTGFEGHDPHIS